jgi:hypothetical protein
MATKQRKSKNVGATHGNRAHAGAKKNAKKEGKKIRRSRVDLKQIEKQLRAPERPPRLVKAISDSTNQFKTGRYEN